MEDLVKSADFPKVNFKEVLTAIQKEYIISATDKTPQTLTITCKRHYMDKLKANVSTFTTIDSKAVNEGLATFKDLEDKIFEQKKDVQPYVECKTKEDQLAKLPYLYIVPKMHKFNKEDEGREHHVQAWRIMVGSKVDNKRRTTNYTTTVARFAAKVYEALLHSIAEKQEHVRRKRRNQSVFLYH